MGKGIKLNNGKENVYPCPYFPIGYIYISAVNIDPATYFGGVWQQLKDVFLLACGKHTVGETGGEETHKLTKEEMPSHNHDIYCPDGGEDTYAATWTKTGLTYPYAGSTSAGGDQPHNNMPPYLAVYMWQRIK